MKHFLTLAALLVSTLSLAQFTPYNPDADNDQFVGAQDLLAFLPLFGEDWDLDSLTVYAVSELAPAFYCSDEMVSYGENTNWCGIDSYYLTVQIPDDADVIVMDDDNELYSYWLRLPDTFRPLLIFGTSYGWTSLSSPVYTNESGEEINDLRLGPIEASRSGLSYLIPLNSKWYVLGL